ncbi:MAG: PTS transporter subunit EIIC, partial [Acutalibacteraceae bacterium]
MGERQTKASLIRRVEQSTVVCAVRNGLVNITPILIIGAFALILKTFPVEQYQAAIASFAGGILIRLLDFVYSATFGVLSVYMTFSISQSYMRIKADPDAVEMGASLASVLSFFVLSGADLSTFGTDSIGPKSMFLAILTGLGASALYLTFDRFLRHHRHTLFSSGADRQFNRMLSTILPITLVALVFVLINAAVVRLFDVESFRALLSRFFNWLFSHGATGFFKGLFFVLLSSVLWFFGIHGSDTLEGVMQTYFTPGLAANQAAVAAGEAPTRILTKEFFDCFVLMGGCGSAICLLLALLIFSRNRARRSLSATAAFPM